LRIERNIYFHVFHCILLHNFIEPYANMAGRYYPLRTCSVSSVTPNTVPNLAEWCTTLQQGVGESTKPHSTETRDNIIKSRSKRPLTANSSDSDCAGEKLTRSHIIVEDCKGLQIGHRYGCAGQSTRELVYTLWRIPARWCSDASVFARPRPVQSSGGRVILRV